MGFYNNNRNAREDELFTTLILRALGGSAPHELSELSGEALAAISAGSVFCQPSHKAGGHRYEVRYPNGFAASIVKNFGSYGVEADLWEVAVLHQGDDGRWVITYDTDITYDVLGFQTEADVVAVCDRIRALI